MNVGKYANVRISGWSGVYAKGEIVAWTEIGIQIENKKGNVVFMPWFSVQAVDFWSEKRTNKVGQSEPVDGTSWFSWWC